MNREEWLTKAAIGIRKNAARVGVQIPDKVRVSVGWPSTGGLGGRGGKRTTGQCWPPTASADGHFEIFVSPWLSETDDVLKTLTHELSHTVPPTGTGHKKAFQVVAAKLDLDGPPWTTSQWKDDVMPAWASAIAKKLGKYPHAKLDPKKFGNKKQSTRLLKIECPSCGYVARTTAKWIEVGLPICCCGVEFRETDADDDE